MLKKSATSAIIMSGIALLFMVLTVAAWESLRNPSPQNILTELQSASPGGLAALLCLAPIIMVLVIVLPGAFIIHDWSDLYFGTQGAVRWAIFGIVFGTLPQLRVLLPEGNVSNGFSSFLVEKGLSAGLGLVLLFVSHFVAFRLVRRKTS